MIALIQRVLKAQVDVDGETTGRIGPLLALVAVQPTTAKRRPSACSTPARLSRSPMRTAR